MKSLIKDTKEHFMFTSCLNFICELLVHILTNFSIGMVFPIDLKFFLQRTVTYCKSVT